MMRLYACGFNAWNQLRFSGSLLGEPPDLCHLEMLLEDVCLKIRNAGLTSTLVETASGLRLAGAPDQLTKHIQSSCGHQMIAEAGNGRVALANITEDSKICEYKSWTSHPDNPSGDWELGKVSQIVAGRTFFATLSEKGEVWTWGDPRYKACLGRDIELNGTSTPRFSWNIANIQSEKEANLMSRSTSQPGLVKDLESLPTGPIVKIAAGGYVTAALTAGNDLYLWGVDEYLHLDGQPTPLDLGDLDILDVGVGDSHVIILTSDGRLLVVGKGANGQLGMGEGVEELREWKEIELRLEPGWRPQLVGAGPKCSFVIVTNEL